MTGRTQVPFFLREREREIYENLAVNQFKKLHSFAMHSIFSAFQWPIFEESKDWMTYQVHMLCLDLIHMHVTVVNTKTL